ncbi:response regulator transcription factor [Maribacter algarum]|uniref:Response regulator transcription factor n=1 Tax=Maribacter algarum (ex Zhang et al. 2020) TaxID=2578118 RepID=A0A5S3QMD0_9FLAO|nr:LytTR family DNA-binding domain-containing protein [Maribacter algarum]TMM59044.1 response regulator transcription factor [Maribacter algarum]
MSNFFTCVIVEDDISSSDFIKNVIAANFSEVTILSAIPSVREAERELQRLKPDFVILDINLEDGNAFTLLKELDTISFKILFVTAHNEYAVEAFKFSALDFLLKPIFPEDLIISIKKIINELQNQQYHKQLEAFFHNYGKNNDQKKLVLKNLEAVHIINLEDIIYINSDNNYSNFNLKNGRKILVSKTLKSFDERLQEQSFFRVHQSYIVNLKYVLSFDKKKDMIVLLDDISLPVAQRKRSALVDFLNR